MSEKGKSLSTRIDSREAVVGVIGLGYVGLPLALAFAEGGFKVLGFDVDESKVDRLRSGQSYIDYIDSEKVSAMVKDHRLEATSDFSRLADTDAILICVPTPLTMNREPDMSFVKATAEQIRKRLRPGQLVILESTTYPGTTDEMVKETLEESGLRCGEDFYLAFSPEREDPGNPSFGPASIPKVIGGDDETSTALADALYGKVVVETIPVSSTRVAEAAKLTENIFRAVNIALVNELKVVYDEMGIDIWEVLDAAATKPFGFMRFNPGPGWGGHCIPIDPFYLSWKARQFGVPAKFIELAGEVNIAMPRRVVQKLQNALNKIGKTVQGSRVFLLGIAYKRDVADPRESPAFEILWQLQQLGADLGYHDPWIPETPAMRSWERLRSLRSEPLTAEVLRRQDAVVIVTDHSNLDYDLILEHAPLIIDTRGIFRHRDSKVISA